MNRIYRLVFNRALGQLQAVSEFASRRTGGATGRTGLSVPARLARSGLAVGLLIATAQAWAQDHTLPGNHTILGNSGGALELDRTTPGVLEITQSGRTIIQWDSFNIGADARVNFTQGGAGSVALNYVPNGGVSSILGDLTANAGVYLINPNGVLFGAGAEVNVGNLLVSTMSPQANWDQTPWQQHFVATGGLTLAEQSHQVVSNYGSITANDGILLAGNAVFNDAGGRIEVVNGDLAILSAQGVEVTNRDGRFNTVVGQNVRQAAPGAVHLVHNLGRLSADNIMLSARLQDRIVGTAMNVSGVVEANSLDIQSWGGALTLAGEISVGSLSAETRQTVPHTTVYDIYQPIEARPLTVSGEASFDSSGNVQLYGASNRLLGPVKLSGIEAFIDTVDHLVLEPFSLGSLSVRGVGSLTFRGGTLTGFLDVDREGDITQTGALTVQGTTFLDSGVFFTALNHAGNDFGGIVDAYGAGVSLYDRNDLTFNSISDLGGSALTLTAAGTLTLPNHAIDTGSSALTLSSGGLLATAGALSGGAVSLHGGTGVAIHHAVAGSAGIDLSSGGAIVQSLGGGLTTPVLGITGTSAILDGGGNAVGALGDVDLEQHFDLRNDRAIVQRAGTTVVVGGTTTLAAGSGAVVLENENNDFVGTVDAFGNGIALRSRNDLSIGTLVNAADAGLRLTAGRDLVLPGGAIDTGSGVLTLRADNRISNVGALRGSAVDVYGGAGLELAHDITAGNHLRLGSGGSITQSGGTLLAQSLEVDASGAAALTRAGNRIDALGDIVTGGQFALRNNGAIAQQAGTVLDVGDNLDLDAGSAAITIANAGNQIGGSATLRGSTISARTAGRLHVASIDAGADQAVSLVAGDALTLGSGIAIDTGSAALTLASDGGSLSTSGGIAGGDVRLRGRDGIVLGGDVRADGPLALQSAAGAIRQTGGAIVAAGSADIVAAGDVSLTGAANAFSGLVTLSGADLDIRNAGTLRLGAVDGSALEATATRIELNRSIATTGDQSYAGAVRLATDLTLESTGGGIAFGSSVDGAHALTVRAADALAFGGAVGTDARLRSLDASGAGIALGSDVVTSGLQIYRDAVTLTGNAGLQSQVGDIDFVSTVDGAHALQVTTSGTVGFGGAVGGTQPLASLVVNAGGIRLGGDVSTSGDQRYGGAVLLTGDTDLSSAAGGIGFAATVDGAYRLGATARAGAASFGGAIGGNARLAALAVDAGSVSTAAGVAVTGDLSIDAETGGLVAQGPYLIGGTSTFATGGGRIELRHDDNDFAGRVDIAGAGDVVIADANALTFGTVTAASLDATARGNLLFGTTTLTGALTARSTEGFIRHAGAADIGGATTLTARHDIMADNTGNAFAGTVALRGANARIIGRDALRFGAVDVSTLQAVAPELWLGADMNSVGFQLYAGDVRLSQDTRIASVVGDIEIRGTVDGAHALEVAAGGRAFLRQAVGGTTALTALEVGSGVNGNIFLGGDIATVGDQTYRTTVLLEGDAALQSATGDITFGDTVNGAYGLGATARAGAVTFAGAVGAGEALRALDVDALTFSGQGIRVTGDLDIRIAQGDLVQGGLYDVGGDATFATGGGRIGLDGQPNAFAGAVGLTGGAAAIANTRNLTFGAVDVSSLTASVVGDIVFDGPLRTTGGLRTISSGDVRQREALTVGGTAEFDALGRAITLDHLDNTFGQPVDARGGAVTLAAGEGLRLGRISAQTLDAIAHGGDLRFTGPLAVRGTLDARAAGAIGQSGAMTVEGVARFETGGGAITLDGQANQFQGLVHLDGGAATVRNQGELALGTVNAASLDATAQRIALGAGTVVTAGDQTYRSAVDLVGTTRLTSLGGDIAFASTVDGAHALQTTAGGTVGFDGAVGGSEALASLDVDADGIVLGHAVSTLGDQRYDGAMTLTGAVNLDSTQGDITLAGTVDGTHALQAIARGDTGRVSIDGAIGATDALAALDVIASGIDLGADVSTTGRQRYAGLAMLTNPDSVAARSGGAVALTADALLTSAQGDITFNATVDGAHRLDTVARGGEVMFRGDVGAAQQLDTLTVDASTFGSRGLAVDDALSIRIAQGDLVQGGAYRVGGAMTITTAGGAIDLSHPQNEFMGEVSLGGGWTTVSNGRSLRLGTVDVSRLMVTAAGAVAFDGPVWTRGALLATSTDGITQTAALRVDGTASLDAGGQRVVLADADNVFDGTVNVRAGAASFAAADALTFGTVNVASLEATAHGGDLRFTGPTLVAGALDAHAGGAIGQSGAPMEVRGTARLGTDGGAITLGGPANRLLGVVDIDGGAVTLRNQHALRLGAISAGTLAATAGPIRFEGPVHVRGDLLANSAGAIEQAAALQIGGTATFDSNGHAITLTETGNLFGGRVNARGNHVSFATADALMLGTITAQTLDANAGSDLTLAGRIVAQGDITLSSQERFINTRGADALHSTGGRWLVHLPTVNGGHQYNGLDSGNSGVLGMATPGDVTATGNRYAFADTSALVLTTTDRSKTYGQTADVGDAYRVDGLLAGVRGAYRGHSLADVLGALPQATSAGSDAAASVAGGPYAIELDPSGLTATGYALHIDNAGQLTVDPATLVIAARDASKIYGQTSGLGGYTVDGLVNGDTVGSVDLASAGAVATANVGEYLITASNADGSGLANYDITYVDGVLSVGRAGLTITAGNAGKTYGQTSGLGGYTVDGLTNGDTVGSVDLASAGAVATANVGEYLITASNADGSGLANYNITYVDGTLTIGKAGLTITAANAGKTYGDALALGGYTVDGLRNSDAVSGVDLASDGTATTANVGTYTITADNADGTGLANYDITYVDGTLTIGKAGLTITAANVGKTYGDALALGGYTVDGLRNSDAVSGVDLASDGTATTANVGTYTITADNADGTGLANYDIVYVDGTLTIGKAGLTITAANAGKTYGDGLVLDGYSVDGLRNDDAVSGVDLASNGTATTANVGIYTITADNADGTGLANYDITYVDGTLTIGKAGLTITAANAGKTYGDGLVLDGYSVDGLRNDDAVSNVDLSSAGTAATANVGDYVITASNADGTGLSNYDITYVGGVLSIGKAGLTITAANAGKTYGDALTLNRYSVDGLRNSDAVSGVDLASAGTATTTNVGDYTITAANADGTGLSNYDIRYVDGTLSIGKAGLVIRALNASKPLGRAITLDAYAVDGLRNADRVDDAALRSDGAPASATAGQYAIRIDDAAGAGLHNYDIAYVAGTLQVGSLSGDDAAGVSRAVDAARTRATRDADKAAAGPAAAGWRIEGGGLRIPPDALCDAALHGPDACPSVTAR